MNIQNLVLDINKKPFQIITANTGEVASRFIRINIVDGATPIDLTGITVSIYAEKPDGKKVFNNVTIEDKTNGIVLAELTSQVLAVEGSVKLNLLLEKDNARLCTKQFLLKVDKSLVDDEAIESINEFGVLTKALNKVDEWNGYFEETSGKIEEKYTERLNQVNSQLEHNANIIKNNILINVKDLGAIGDGISDDTNVFINAKEYGNNIYVPDGVYKINKKIELNGINLIGESSKNTLLDFSDCIDDECIYITGAKNNFANFSIKTNNNIENQFALKCHYCTDGTKIQNLFIEKDASNGIFVERSWYLSFENIRMKSISSDGIGVQINNHINGGVNGVVFKDMFITGSKHSVLFTGNEHYTEAIKFIGGAMMKSYKTSIVCNSTNVNSVEFDTCYFEYCYQEPNDSNVPIVCSNLSPSPISITNSIMRLNDNNRFIVKGNVILDKIYNANSIKLTDSYESEIIIKEVKNIMHNGRSYHNTQKGSCIVEKISAENASYLYKTQVIKKQVENINEKISVFRLQKPSSTNTFIKVEIIFNGSKSYVNAYLKYNLFDIGRGSGKQTVKQNVECICPYKSNFLDCFNLEISNTAYDANTDSHIIDVSITVTDNELIGECVFIIDGINGSGNDIKNRNIVEL